MLSSSIVLGPGLKLDPRVWYSQSLPALPITTGKSVINRGLLQDLPKKKRKPTFHVLYFNITTI